MGSGQGMFANLGKLGIKALMQYRAEQRKREFEMKRDELRMAHESQQLERRIASNMEIARQNRQLQEKLAIDAAQNQLKIALFNAEMQLKLSRINAENQQELARFNAEAQQELARFNAKNQMEHSINMAELGYNLQAFPLYIRSWSSKDLLQNAEFLPVKVVVIPPDEDSGRWERYLTSQITDFMQRNVPRAYYEFLGGAWRGGRCTGQTAYKMIYKEFRQEPFLIVDSDFIDGNHFSLRICFWHPDSAGIADRQLINDWDIRGALRLPQAGQPQDNGYESMKLCAALCGLTISSVVDIYQMAIGVSRHSENLKRLPEIVKEISALADTGVCLKLTQGILEEYRTLIQSEYSLDPMTRLHCTCELAEAIYELGKLRMVKGSRREAEAYVEDAWEQWCRLMGISMGEFWDMLQSKADMETLRGILQEDTAAMKELAEIFGLYDKFNKSDNRLTQLAQKVQMTGGIINEVP